MYLYLATCGFNPYLKLFTLVVIRFDCFIYYTLRKLFSKFDLTSFYLLLVAKAFSEIRMSVRTAESRKCHQPRDRVKKS